MLYNFIKSFILFLIIQIISGNGFTIKVIVYSLGGALVYSFLLYLLGYIFKRDTK